MKPVQETLVNIVNIDCNKFFSRYVRCDEMAAKAVDVVKTKELKIIPEQFEKTW
jgi:valyl-tRNA synthetase